MTYRGIDDIEREKAERKREEFKKDVSKDIKDVFGSVFEIPKKKIEKIKKRWTILKWFCFLLLFLFVITMLLGVAWLLKTLIKSLFFGG